MYAVAEFLRSGTIKECALIPVLWLTDNNTRCFWPRTKNDQQFRNLVQTNVAHELSWPIYPVHRVLYTGDDYGSAEQFMAHVIEQGTSEDGITTFPITAKKLTSEVTIISNDSNENQESDIASQQKTNNENENTNSRKKRKKQHKRSKSSKKNKCRKDSTSCSNDTEDCSQDQENDLPLTLRYQRSLTGLQSLPRQDISIITEGRDISVNADFPTNVNVTPQRNIVSRNAIDTPRSSQSTPGPRGVLGGISEERVFKYLDQINRGVDQNQIMLSQILRINQALSQVQNCTMPQGLPDFPVSSLDVFEEFDASLQNEEHRAYIMQRLASVGGLSQRQAVMNMLKFLMTNSLAMNYNWAGREKRSFKKTNVMKILNEAAKVAFRGKQESSDANIASAVKDWLKLATSRHMYSVTGKNATPQ